MAALTEPAFDSSEALYDMVVWQDAERMGGVPCFAGTRVPVKSLFDYLEAGDTINEFLDAFPGVTREQALGALRIGKGRLLEAHSA